MSKRVVFIRQTSAIQRAKINLEDLGAAIFSPSSIF